MKPGEMLVHAEGADGCCGSYSTSGKCEEEQSWRAGRICWECLNMVWRCKCKYTSCACEKSCPISFNLITIIMESRARICHHRPYVVPVSVLHAHWLCVCVGRRKSAVKRYAVPHKCDTNHFVHYWLWQHENEWSVFFVSLSWFCRDLFMYYYIRRSPNVGAIDFASLRVPRETASVRTLFVFDRAVFALCSLSHIPRQSISGGH